MTEHMPNPLSDSADSCPLCSAAVQNSPYPRHRLILEDESDIETNHHTERRLCSECWEQLREQLTPPEFAAKDTP